MKAKNKEKKDNFLLYVPKRKHETWEVKQGKVYLVFHHNKKIEKCIRWLVKKPYVSDIELDSLGSRVWGLMDGMHSVYEIGKTLEKELGEGCQGIQERLIMYLRYLNRRGWIAFERGNQA